MIPKTSKPNIIISTRITDYNSPESIFLATEMPKILEEAIEGDVPVIVFISNDRIYIRIIAPEDITIPMKVYENITKKLLEEKEKIEAMYNINIDLKYILDKIIIE